MDAIAIQDANKIRIAMGLAPLPVPGEDKGLSFKESQDEADDSDANDHISTLERRQAAAGDNWKRLQDEEQAKRDRQARKDAAKKQREAAARFAKLEGKGLGEAAEDEVDTKTWLLQQKKRQKQIEKARKFDEEQAAREQQAEYTSKDLAGLKVTHEMDKFGEDGEQILTLKDAEIGAESDEDELENADLLAREKLQEQLELKKKKPVYDPNEADETGERSILKHYDEDGGKKRKRFTLDEQGRGAPVDAPDTGEKKGKGLNFSLDLLQEGTPASDYLDASTAKIRKPKKKKAKTTRHKEADEDDIYPVQPVPIQQLQVDQDKMEVDGTSGGASAGPARKSAVELDDDDLQAQLAQQRRLALKKRKKVDAAELARRIREEESATPAAAGDDDDDEPGMVIDETSEFVANLQRPTAQEETRPRTLTTAVKDEPSEDEDGDTAMAQALNEVEEQNDLKERVKRESSTPAAPQTSTGFEQEDTLDQGIGASLSMLRKRGLIQDANGSEQNIKDRARDQFLAENRMLIEQYDTESKEQRDRDRKSGRFDRMSARERETYARQQNEQREAYLARLQAEHFKKNYRPDVKLKYIDDFGRSMNAKEAFKHQSHAFHGRGSGKQKTEKMLKKIENEKKAEAMSSLDASQHTGMNSAMGATARKNRQAGVRLQ